MTNAILYNALRQAAVSSQQEDFKTFEGYEWNESGVILTDDEISALANQILAFPLELRNILFAHYYFDLSTDDITKMFGIDLPMGKLNYARWILSCAMSLSDRIDDSSILSAVEIAVTQYTSIDSPLQIVPKYSHRFRRKLREIQAVQATRSLFNRIMHREAVILLVCAIGFSTALVVDADLREDFLNWLIETFPAFSIFHKDKDSDGERGSNNLSYEDIEIGYLPIDYELDYYQEVWNKVVYCYSFKQKDYLVITFSNNDPLYADTDSISLNVITLQDNPAYWWKRNKRTYLVWLQNGVSCNISANLPIEEIIRVAEKIKIK